MDHTQTHDSQYHNRNILSDEYLDTLSEKEITMAVWARKISVLKGRELLDNLKNKQKNTSENV
jgi:hypothetical protein